MSPGQYVVPLLIVQAGDHAAWPDLLERPDKRIVIRNPVKDVESLACVKAVAVAALKPASQEQVVAFQLFLNWQDSW